MIGNQSEETARTSDLEDHPAGRRAEGVTSRRYLTIATLVLAAGAVMYLVLCWFVLSRSLVPVRTAYEVSPPEFAERVDFRSTRDDVPLTGWRLPSTGSRSVPPSRPG